MNEPFGATIFCDDIRGEVLNKVSLMGVYGYELLIPGSFPAILPKLGLFMLARFHRSEPVNGADVIVYFPGDPEDQPTLSQHINVQLSEELFPQPSPEEYPDPGQYLGFNHPVTFSPAIIKQPGYIRVRVIAGERRVKLGSLKIREPSPQEREKLGMGQ